MAYLDAHPNRNLAQQRPRRDKPSGVIVVHTAESALDEIGEDTGAEGVARYISERTTYGSYHRLADSDSVVAVARFEMTTYGDGTGSNDFAIHISFACRAADWPRMSRHRREAFIRNGAKAAAEAARWLRTEHGITVPARRISRAQSDQRVPGFISHAERDPSRRTDPGAEFPWRDFLGTYRSLMEDDMPTPTDLWDHPIPIYDGEKGEKRKARVVLSQTHNRAGDAREAAREANRSLSDLARLVGDVTLSDQERSVLAGEIAERTAQAVQRLDAAAVAERLEVTTKEQEQ